MKTILIPASITLCVPGTDRVVSNEDGSPREVTFSEFVSGTILSDPSWVKDFAHVKAAFALSEALKKAPGESFAFEDADYSMIKSCAETPSQPFQGWHPAIMPQLFPFFRAILELK